MSFHNRPSYIFVVAIIVLMTATQAFAWGSSKDKDSKSYKKDKHKKDYDDIKRRDRERDANTPAKPLEKESIVRRYAQRKKDLQRDIKPGEHFTAPVKPGRPPGAQTAQKRYGLEKPPKWEGTVRLDKELPVKKNKATGGQPGYGEGISTQKIPKENVVKIQPVR